MMIRWLLVGFITLLLAGCGSNNETEESYLLLWHSWSEPQAAGLIRLIEAYEAIHPEVDVIVSALPSDDQLLSRFEYDTQLGLGPNLLIGPNQWVPRLAEAGLIQNLAERPETIDSSPYLSTAMDTLRYQDGLYGLPLTLDMVALYYNNELVKSPPPQRVETLLSQAPEENQKIALNTSFEGAFWGVKAFGGQLFDQNSPEPERLVLDRGGFANWLSWLRQAQDNPNVILDSDGESLLQLFKDEEVAYYTGTPEVLAELQESLGEEKVRVAPLPAGPNGPSGPFLRTEALMFNTWSSSIQAEQALHLARFLTSIEQQTKLARQTAPLVPANSRVRLNPQVYPAVAGFLAQSKTAVPAPHLPQVETLFQYGDEAYLQALSGAEEPSNVAANLTRRVNEAHGFSPIHPLTQNSCPTGLAGTISIWHGWPEAEAEVLAQIAGQFSELCPEITVELAAYPDDLEARYREAAGRGQGPELLIAPSGWVVPLAEAELIADITTLVEPELLQQYVLAAQQTMQYEEKLYGLPLAMELIALYYKADQVADPPRLIEELLTQATPEQEVALPTGFREAFWGLTAFGGISADPESNTLFLDEAGITAWLEWLRQARDRPGVQLNPDAGELLSLFAEGKAIYFAGSSTRLWELQRRLGDEQLRVAPLPAGPANEATPLLTTEGFMLNPAVSEAAQPLAMAFAKYVTGAESQTILQQRARLLPTNINVNIDRTAYPAVAGFMEQARTTLPQLNYPGAIWEAGDALYEAALNEETELSRLISQFFEQVIDGQRIVDMAQQSQLEEAN